jgi:ribonuclease P protein component
LKKYTFNKKERLCHRKDIEILFQKNKSFLIYPFKILYKIVEKQDNTPIKVLISVPKRNIKHAVDRNLLKRRIKEAYRKNKISLSDALEKNNTKIQLALIYVSKEIVDYSFIEKKILLTLQRLITDNEKNS